MITKGNRNEQSFVGSEISFTSGNNLKESQKIEPVISDLIQINDLSHRDAENLILSPKGPQYQTLTPIGEIQETDNINPKDSFKDRSKATLNTEFATILKPSRRVSAIHTDADQFSNSIKADIEGLQNIRRRGSSKNASHLEDDYRQIMQQNQHPNLIINLDDHDDDIINQSLSQIPTSNKGS